MPRSTSPVPAIGGTEDCTIQRLIPEYLEVFESGLLDFHIQQVEIFSEAIKACETIQPDVLNLFLEYKTDLFFHKQLRINRDKAEFKKCFEKAFSKVEEALLDKWTDYLGLGDQQLFATAFLRLIAENFLLQMSERNFGEKYRVTDPE